MFDVFSIIGGVKIINYTKMKFFSILFYFPSYIIAKLLMKVYLK